MRTLLLTGLLALSSMVQAEIIELDNAQFEKLAKSGVPVIDIRTQAEWEETGIVAGSKLLTFFDAKGEYNAPAWLEKVKPIAKANEPVILICRTGNRTKPVSQFLSQQAGYSTVYTVKSGIKGWVGDGKPVVPAAQTIAACKAGKTC